MAGVTNYYDLLVKALENGSEFAKKFARTLKSTRGHADIAIFNSGRLAKANFYTTSAMREVSLGQNSILNEATRLRNPAARRFGLQSVATYSTKDGTTVNLVFDHNVSGLVPGVDSLKIGERQFYVHQIPMEKSQELFRAMKSNG